MSQPCQNCSAPAELYLCTRCSRNLVRMLDDAPWYMYQLAIAATGGHKLAAQPHAARIIENPDEEQSPVSFNAVASNHLIRCHQILAKQTVRVAEINPFPPAGFIGPLHYTQHRLRHTQPSAADHARWLAHFYTLSARRDNAGRFYADVQHKIIGKTTALINRPLPPVYRGPCPHTVGTSRRGKPITCSQPLYSRRGEDHVACARCGNKYDVAKIEQSLLADMEHYVFTVTDLFRVLKELGEPLPKSTFYAWKGAGRLREAGWLHPDGTRSARWRDDRDRPVYRLSDVRRLRAASEVAS